MNRAQLIALSITALNMVLVLLFPPYDYLSLSHGNIPTFDGFYFVFGNAVNRVINTNFLALEAIVVLINGAIAWLLFRTPPARKLSVPGGNRNQRVVLGLVALNLILMLLFPPFENFSAITKAALPTFEGFYFVLSDNSHRQIVTPILYIEVALAIINGGLLWLLFKDKGREELSAEQVRAMANRIRAAQRK